MPLPPVRRQGDLFVDAHGRQVTLRGVNLGGDCKVPYPNGGTNFPSDFADHRDVSFVGRPFPLAEADEHLGRLKHWGFNVVRLLTTWEAVEHSGPGLYDTDYLDFLAEVCRRAGEHGQYVFIDFHQDVWSRMTGGDGAPGWCFEAVGLDLTRFHAADAAHVMQRKFNYGDLSGRQAAYPQMSWGSNYRLPANGIMWSLFWGGRLFTPDFMIEGENVQAFLQNRYLGCLDQVARRIAHLPNVLGFDTLNEPGVGYFGEPLSYRHLGPSEINPARARPGAALSPLDALAMARGLTVEVPVLKRNLETSIAEPAGQRTMNPDGVSIWMTDCPFERAGAYAVEGGRAEPLREDFFQVAQGRPVNISDDGFGPLFHEVARVIRKHEPTWPIFAELDAFGAAAGRPFPTPMPENSVNASHWYDATTLFLKSFDPTNHYDFMTGAPERDPGAIRDRYVRQLAGRQSYREAFPGGAPSLIGEFGIPYDLDDGAAYKLFAQGRRDEAIWARHTAALGLMYDALDALGLHSTQWNYTASNRNDLRIGDGWNQEDLSIFSRDQQEDPADPDSGGRAIEGFCRPFAHAVQGRLTRVRFDRATRRLEIDYQADPTIAAATEIYVPKRQFPGGFSTRVEGAAADLDIAPDVQRVRITALDAGPVRVIIQGR
ncbi:glycoside hydrolase family 5 protein [Phenylobacterium sp.]|uniref:glycoside hydrolase family 5 protein n=1 Tax=Phenylobacterium sp. TaxID=1871053 RepID=UPI002FCBE780